MKLACIALVLATTTTAFAEEMIVVTAPPPRTIGVDGVAILPLGDYGRVATAGIGALARLEVPVATGGSITGRIGVIAHQLDDGFGMSSLTFVPVYAGYRQPVGTAGMYVAGELGITFGYASNSAIATSDSELGFTLTVGLRRGAFDLRGGLFAPDADDVHGFMASVGYDFAAF